MKKRYYELLVKSAKNVSKNTGCSKATRIMTKFYLIEKETAGWQIDSQEPKRIIDTKKEETTS